MFIFTWIDSNYRKNDLTIKDTMKALMMYNILHDKAKVHNLKCLMKFDDVESYVIFVNNRIVAV